MRRNNHRHRMYEYRSISGFAFNFAGSLFNPAAPRDPVGRLAHHYRVKQIRIFVLTY